MGREGAADSLEARNLKLVRALRHLRRQRGEEPIRGGEDWPQRQALAVLNNRPQKAAGAGHVRHTAGGEV